METKGAIMVIKKLKRPIVEYKDRYYVGDEKERHNDNVILDEVISLLEQGEAYRQMWEKFYKEWGEYPIELHNIAEFMEDIEQKYLKEANPNEADNR